MSQQKKKPSATGTVRSGARTVPAGAKPVKGKPALSKASEGKKRPKYRLDKGALVADAVVLGLIVLLVVLLTNPARGGGRGRIKQVTVKLSEEARQKAVQENITEEDFIRNTRVMGQKIGEIEKLGQDAADTIMSMGYVLDDIRKVSATAIEMHISARVPVAVVSSGGWYVYIDKEGYITDKKSTYTKGSSLLIDGVKLTNANVGLKAEDGSTDERLQNALTVVEIIRRNNWQQHFTDIYMRENKDVWLLSAYGIPIKMNIRKQFADTFEQDLLLAVRILLERKALNQTGQITSIDGDAYWKEDAGEFYSIKGM